MGKASRRKRQRAVKMDSETKRLLDEQLVAFRKKFGRDPGPEDPVFFDPNADVPKPISLEDVESDIIAAMAKADLPPEIIYAYKKTGLLVSEMNRNRLSDEDLEEWNAAIDEYLRLSQREQ
jgi:hypothetical protein